MGSNPDQKEKDVRKSGDIRILGMFRACVVIVCLNKVHYLVKVIII